MSRSRGVKALFERMDRDGSRKVDSTELRHALGEDNVSNEVVDKLFKKYDKNHDGVLDEKEIKRFFKENNMYLDLCNENLMPTPERPSKSRGGVKGLFERIDKDGSQKIDCRELREALGEDNVSSQLVKKLFDEYDRNHDGYLDLKELKKFFKENKLYSDLCAENLKMVDKKHSRPNKGVKGLFEKMDKDGSNKIDCQELREALGEDNISEDLIKKLFKKYDKNNDGVLDRKEVKRFFKSNQLYADLCAANLK